MQLGKFDVSDARAFQHDCRCDKEGFWSIEEEADQGELLLRNGLLQS